MIRFQKSFSFLLFVALGFLLLNACSKSSTTGVTDNLHWLFKNNHAYAKTNVFATKNNFGGIQVVQINTTADSTKAFIMTLSGVAAPGTFVIGTNGAANSSLQINEGRDFYIANNTKGSATIVIGEFGTRMKGTFTATVVNASGESQNTIGDFDIPVQ
jgi:hypothetical protein